MKYSLRTLLIAAILVPPVLAGVIWRLIPAPPAKRGSATDMAVFLRVVKQPYPGSDIFLATDKCFAVGAPSSPYQTVLAKADKVGASDNPAYATGRQYEFWCEGKNPATEGDAKVVIIVDGKPPVITYAEVWVASK